MKALIQGTRICQTVPDDKTFPVHNDLQWVSVSDDTVVDKDRWVDGAVVKYVEPVPSALDKIMVLETAITPRRIRDSVLTDDGRAWLDSQEKLIAVERGKL